MLKLPITEPTSPNEHHLSQNKTPPDRHPAKRLKNSSRHTPVQRSLKPH